MPSYPAKTGVLEELHLWHACGELQPKGYGRYLWDVLCTSDVTPSETVVSGMDIKSSSTSNFYIIALDHMSPSVLLLLCTHAVPVFVHVFGTQLVVERRIRRNERGETVEAHLLRRIDVCPEFCGGQR